jgi:ribose 5-phosphate isomerase A
MTRNIAAEKKMAALEAVKQIKDGMVVGLGTGSTAMFATEAVGSMVAEGLKIRAVPTSESTRQLADSLAIPLVDINTIATIDITIDGADEFTNKLELIKGGGGALLREKIVASLTRLHITIADDSKYVDKLGKFRVPIEVIPFACNYVLSTLGGHGGTGTVRKANGSNFITDQGNFIIDTDFGLIENPADLAAKLDQVVGVVEHGLFVNLTHLVIMASGDNIIRFSRH